MIKFFTDRSLTQKIFILMLIVGILPGLLMVTGVYLIDKRVTLESSATGIAGTAKIASFEVTSLLQSKIDRAKLLAASPEIITYLTSARPQSGSSSLPSSEKSAQDAILQNELSRYIKNFEKIDNQKHHCIMLVADRYGAVIAATRPVPERSFSQRIWWQDAMKGSFSIGGPHNCISGKQSNNFHFAVPILGPESTTPLGVLYLEDHVEDVLSPLSTFTYGETGHFEMIGMNSGKYSFIMEPLGATRRPVPEWLAAAFRESPSGWAEGIDEHGIDSIAGFARVEVNDWYVVLRQAKDEIYKPVNVLVSGASMPGIIAVMILAAIWYMLSRTMVLMPLEVLKDGVSRISEGRLDFRIDIRTGDELQVLAHDINVMADKLMTAEHRMIKWNDELKREVEERTSDLEKANADLKENRDEAEMSLHQLSILNEELEAGREEIKRRNKELASANLKLREMDRLKSEFLANMSHELRTPLTAIIGFSELLIDEVTGELNEEQSGYVENILTSGQHLLKLISDILDLSKIEAGKMELHFEQFQLANVLDFVKKTVTPLLGKKKQRLVLEIADGMPDIYADPGKIKQLLLNLVGNAIKFSPIQSSITIHTEYKDKSFELSVKDAGIGIKPEDRERIFHEFQQAEASISRQYEGTGLGLALTKRLTEMHGGTIELESEVGKGSIFTVYLPLRSPDDIPSTLEVTHGINGYSTINSDMRLPYDVGQEEKPLVLIVEDDVKHSKLVSMYLTQAGYAVEMASDGETAIMKAMELKPFAITLDILLPRKDGWEVIQELKEMPDTKDIPIIILSMVENQEIGFALGVFDYIVKPVNRDELLTCLKKYVFVNRISKGLVKVLIIDDDRMISDFLTSVLKREGFVVNSTPNGEEGLISALKENPDIIMLDLMMQGTSGVEVIKELKRYQSTRDIPLFVLTSRELSAEEKSRLLPDVSKIINKGQISKYELIEEIRRVEQLGAEKPGLTDNVTGIFNQHYFTNRLSEELSRAERYDKRFSVSLINIDHFHHYNEVNGYLQGDIILREISWMLSRNLRRADLFARYRGGAFAVMLPETTWDAAILMIDKLRNMIEDHPFPRREGQPEGRITISFSVGAYPEDGRTVPELMAELEKTVKAAYVAGGNRGLKVTKGHS